MKRALHTLLLLLVFCPSAAACGICVSAMADAVLPPIHWWATIGAVWFLATAAATAVFRTRLPAFPRPLVAFLIPPALFLASSVWGTGPFVLLIPVSLVVFGIALFTPRAEFDRRGLRLSIIVLGICGIAAVIVMAFWSYEIRTTRTRVDYLLRWSGTVPERRILHNMTEEDPEPLDEYRSLYERAGLVAAAFVAERIGEIGDPAKDIPLLESRLDDFRAEDWAEFYLEDVENAVESLESRTGAAGASAGRNGPPPPTSP
jgi:hypothetical protein